MAVIQCDGAAKKGLRFPTPLSGIELGERIQAGDLSDLLGQWLQHQTMLINHYGLNLRDPEAKQFLTEQTEKFLFGGDSEEVDTTKKGTICW